MWTQRARRALVERGGLVLLGALAFYAALAAPTIVDGDNSELAALGAVGGAAHPSGYPADVLWLRAWSWLPGASPAHTAALATAILGALGAWVVYLAARAWGARGLAAAITAGIYAVAPQVVRYATEAEVFAGNQLVAALILWLAAAAGPARGAARVGLLALAAGLGLAGHSTCVLLAPVGLLGAARGVRESRWPWPATVAVGVGALAAGLAPYLYLFVAPDSPASWGAVRSWPELYALFTRADYGGPGTFSPKPGDVDVGANLAALGRDVARAWWGAPCVAGLLGLARGCARRPPRDGEPRAGWIALAASLVLAGPVLAARFNIAPSGMGLYVCRRFYLLPTLLMAPAVAVALDELGARAWARVGANAAGRVARWAGPVAALAVAAAAVVGLPGLAAVRTPALEVGVREMLRAAPPDAVLFVTQELGFGAHYLQVAEGERPDVLVVMWSQAQRPWYRARLARAGITVTESGEEAASVRVARDLLARGRPVLVDAYAAQIVTALPTYPYGVLFRVLPPGTAAPSVDELLAINARLFDGWHLDYAPPGPGDEFATLMHQRYARTWLIIADAVARAQGPAAARIPLAYAERFGPTSDEPVP